MFLGSFQTKFSGKNRVILPKKFRSEIGKSNEIILTRGLDGCIWGFNKKDWEKEAERQLEIPLTEDKGRYLRRNLFASAESTELDLQGRFVITSSLVDFAHLGEEVILIGAGDHFEIWNPSNWGKIIGQKEQ